MSVGLIPPRHSRIGGNPDGICRLVMTLMFCAWVALDWIPGSSPRMTEGCGWVAIWYRLLQPLFPKRSQCVASFV